MSTFLEPILRALRQRRAIRAVRQHPNCRLLDIGCGTDASFLTAVEGYISLGIGIDSRAVPIDRKRLKIIPYQLGKKLPFDDASFDFVTRLAVMEHLEFDEDILWECARILRPGDAIFITVPSWRAKPILEFLAFVMGFISRDEIRDHKRYYDREDLFRLVGRTKSLRIKEHHYFQFRCNNSVYIERV